MGGFFVLDSANMLVLDFNEQNIWKLQVNQRWGEQLMKLRSEKVQTDSHGNREQLRVPTVLYKKENANIPIFNPITNLEIPAQNFEALLRTGWLCSQLPELWLHLPALLHLDSGRLLQGGGTRVKNASPQVEDYKLSHQVRMWSEKNECRGLWDVSQNACEKQKSWRDCHRMDFINSMVCIFWALWYFFFCFFDALSKYSPDSVKMTFFWVGAENRLSKIFCSTAVPRVDTIQVALKAGAS